jgi:cytochrome c-type biogenesis protein CcmH
MSVFVIAAVGLVLLALAIVLPTLLRNRPDPSASTDPSQPGSANLAILRGEMARIEAALAAGTLDSAQHSRERAELERRVIEETRMAGPAASARYSKPSAVLIGLAIPCLAIGLYWKLGNPQALLADPAAAQVATDAKAPGSEVTITQIEGMVAQMAERLENPPPGMKPDAQAWEMLARAYGAIQKFPEADRAYARAIELAPSNAQLLADRADVLALVQGQSSNGEPMRLVERALKMDPKNLKALALAGSAAFERKDFASATNYWKQARALAPADSEFAASLDKSLQAANEAGGAPAGTVAGAPVTVAALAAASAGAGAGAGAATTGSSSSSVSGEARLAPALASKVAPGDTVFIFARAADGPRMPLAILKRTAAELPIRFTLDDSMAMSPQMQLSKFKQVVVSVRVSKSGNALPQSGDLVGQSGPLTTGASGIALVIDGVQP